MKKFGVTISSLPIWGWIAVGFAISWPFLLLVNNLHIQTQAECEALYKAPCYTPAERSIAKSNGRVLPLTFEEREFEEELRKRRSCKTVQDTYPDLRMTPAAGAYCRSLGYTVKVQGE